MNLYFDTSALFKLFHEEEGSGVVEQLVLDEAGAIRVLELAELEFSSALYRRYRSGELNAENLESALSGFRDQLRYFEVVRLDSDVVERACALMAEHGTVDGLRSLDALQLAAFALREVDGCAFVCADKTLVRVARNAGYEVIDPTEAPAS